ncbi:MAG: DNA mismatch repair endonuclease MutL [Clostridia bacterium]|nr:DNA mismatch repair endonuclease MutL [Clostridia bacterium]
MAKINILTKDIYNRIAAGEVVANPASAIKELVENSIDAGAKEISVYVEKAGTQLIRVCDDGSGIEQDDMRAAFMSHATSKVSSVDDLENIKTLGFRGEALASIGAISVSEIVSVTEGNQACRVVCEGGYIGKTEPAALQKGTEITVRNLFYNTPARAKFLKTEKQELGFITSCMTNFILGNPDISFKYYSEGKLLLQSFGNGLDEAFSQVYSYKVISQCYKINAEYEGVHISGFISNQNFFKPNKSCQHLFINGRHVVNETVSVAVKVAYQSYTMHRQFPLYVLFIEVPSDELDVNVHPNKAEVRFADNHRIYHAVYTVLSNVLDGTAKAADFVIESSVIPQVQSTMPEKQTPPPVRPAEWEHLPEKTEKKQKEPEKPISAVTEQNIVPEEYITTEPEFRDREKEYSLCEYYGSRSKTENKMAVSFDPYDIYADHSEEMARKAQKEEQAKMVCKTITYKGNLFNTYLLYEIGDDVYIIDQHAAHERLIYNSFMEQIKERKVLRQGMLVPYLFGVTAEENAFLEQNLSVIREMGFDIEPFSLTSYRVNEIPADLQDINLKEFFNDLLSDLNSLKTVKLADVLKDKIAMKACKHAIKGGMAITKEEADKLIADMGGDMGMKCPHGRPVAVKLTKYQIEKMFKRIV